MKNRPVEVGLRARKRLASMRAIQSTALELFDRLGYAHTTVEAIAASAEVSPSSIYRYFGTKEQIVLWGEYDDQWGSRLAQDLGTIPTLEAVRRALEPLLVGAVEGDLEQVRRRVTHMMNEPSIEAASTLLAHEAAEALGTAISAGLGRDHGDLDVQLLSHALVGAVVGGIHHWHESNYGAPFSAVVDEVMRAFERGFSLAE